MRGKLRVLPQVVETNTPRSMDVTEECFLYYEFRPNVHLLVYRCIGFHAIIKW
jgi:hypothetical protein